MTKVFIGGAWPYANGSLHLGRLASLLPGDILARYFRAKGQDVLYVSGSDCHGTPITVKAMQEGISPSDIANHYHQEFVDCFQQLGFTYDIYTRTDQPFHHQVVQQLFLELLQNGYLYKKTVLQTFCETDEQFLPDRYVEGICPVCGNRARGDQCDFCSTLLEPDLLKDKSCKLCGNTPIVKSTEHFYLNLSRFQKQLELYTENSEGWKDNAIQMTKRYLKEGLHDRAATRDLTWGIDVPITGFENKKIYVWVEAVSGYLSASKQWASETGNNWEHFWDTINQDIIAYYVHGKDNIPFHTIIWPAILMGVGGLHLPDRIISCEYMTLEGEKFSTSRNWAVWVPDILKRYDPDSIRYFLIANGPEKRDADFSWREFIYSHNGELLGGFGNFVNRTLAFIVKSFGGIVPTAQFNAELEEQTKLLYNDVGYLIEKGRFKEALEHVFNYVRDANKYFDEQKPWLQIKESREACGNTLTNCVHIIANLANLLQPFIPFACEKIRTFLSIGEPSWELIGVSSNLQLQKIELLFNRIDVTQIDEEMERLEKQKSNVKEI